MVQRLLLLLPQDIEPDFVCSYTDALKEAGFAVAADGLRPGSLYGFTADAAAYHVCGGIDSAREAALEEPPRARARGFLAGPPRVMTRHDPFPVTL